MLAGAAFAASNSKFIQFINVTLHLTIEYNMRLCNFFLLFFLLYICVSLTLREHLFAAERVHVHKLIIIFLVNSRTRLLIRSFALTQFISSKKTTHHSQIHDWFVCVAVSSLPLSIWNHFLLKNFSIPRKRKQKLTTQFACNKRYFSINVHAVNWTKH